MLTFENFDLTNYNSYRVSSTCRYAYFPESEDDIKSFFSKYSKYVLLGSGHNVILSKEHYDLPFLIINGVFNTIKTESEGCLFVEAGAWMPDVAEFALGEGLSGVEIFWDIPSSLGGAVVMNAGASGEEIKDVIKMVRYYDLKDGLCKILTGEHLSFQYRNSFFQVNPDSIVLSATLKLRTGNKSFIRDKMDQIKTQRWLKQPKESPNAGSVFKRPKGFYVGAMIDELDLKGFTVGGAKISEKHGGFIVNFSGATGSDILSIIDEVKRRVRSRFGVELEIEQRII